MSFSEMMESGHGPGVIGMLMALCVLFIFGALFMFAFDERLQGGGQPIESVLAHQAKEIAEIKASISHGEKQLAESLLLQARSGELREMMRQSRFHQSRLESLNKDIVSANGSIDETIMEFENYKDDYRAIIRSEAKGETMSRLETRKGDVYENITIREVTPIGIQIMHDAGHKRIAFEDLSTELQDRFQFDPKQKSEALARENAARSQHDAAVSAALASAHEAAAEKKSNDADDATKRMHEALAAREARIAALEDELIVMEKAIEEEEAKKLRRYSGRIGGISRAPGIRLEMGEKQKELSTLRKQVAVLRKSLSQ